MNRNYIITVSQLPGEDLPPPSTRALPKAPYGSPCNGCGFCCAAEVCAIGREAFGDVPAPCPGMLFDEGRFHCKLVLIESLSGMEPLLATVLGIGKGCDADDY